MRLLVAAFLVVSCSLLLVSGAPERALCPSLPVELELRTSPQLKNRFQLVFAAIDPEGREEKVDFVDIHYRVNNDASVNRRVMTHDAVTDRDMPAKRGLIDGIALKPGDALRAYATYSARGYACDTPIHTFNAPEIVDEDMITNRVPPRSGHRVMQRRVRDIDADEEEAFWSQAAVERESALCPAISLDQDIVKIASLDNSYMLSFENRDPRKQLHYVDLHLSTDAAKGWDNLRLASDMQLHLAHKVMQPGVVIKPHEVLKWYWSYRTSTPDGEIVDCTTPVTQIAPNEVTHEITLDQLNKAAMS